MKNVLVSDWLENYGTDINLLEETTDQGDISPKTGTMKCTKSVLVYPVSWEGFFYREVLLMVQRDGAYALDVISLGIIEAPARNLKKGEAPTQKS